VQRDGNDDCKRGEFNVNDYVGGNDDNVYVFFVNFPGFKMAAWHMTVELCIKQMVK
jgi:hypothetical protein